MAKKGKNAAKQGGDPATNIKFGTRVRHTADGVAGRIVWANAVAVKIQWDDGEKVTWRRADLAAKGLEILAEDEGAEVRPAEPQTSEAAAEPVQTTAPEPTSAEAPPEAAARPEPAGMAGPQAEPIATPEATDDKPEAPAWAPSEIPNPPVSAEPETTPAKPAKKRTKRSPSAEPKAAKLSALDAAAKVLAEHGQPMGCQELIGAMAVKGYWSSPGGKTPAATLYTAVTMLPKAG